MAHYWNLDEGLYDARFVDDYIHQQSYWVPEYFYDEDLIDIMSRDDTRNSSSSDFSLEELPGDSEESERNTVKSGG